MNDREAVHGKTGPPPSFNPGDFAVIQQKSLMTEKRPTAELLFTSLGQEVSSKPSLKKGPGRLLMPAYLTTSA